MTLAGLLVFVAAYALAVASPGPGVAALLARVLSRGLSGIVPFIAGFVVGDLVWFTVAAAGLAALAQTLEGVFTVVRYAGAAYLLYIAWKLITAPAAAIDTGAAPVPEDGRRAFLSSLALTLGNPKTIVFFMALLPTVVDLRTLTVLGALEIAGTIIVVLSALFAAYALAAARARRLFRSARAMKALNVGTGAVMAGAAVAVATR
ncbi:MAG TPA: LysE family translocator [Azospirillaceae bacterium]|nr:LysE family translocator [Azospirillaceae bacterium]